MNKLIIRIDSRGARTINLPLIRSHADKVAEEWLTAINGRDTFIFRRDYFAEIRRIAFGSRCSKHIGRY